MPLAAGTRLGAYEIVSPLGAGGMGEVYRARDTRLGRDVAIKVLPPDVARDANRLNRFRHEARSLAAIDHPNIVTVFSVEEASIGTGDDLVYFLTMQLVQGASLDRVIPDAGLPLERILEVSAAIADALAAAHDKSIVHRDLKPANVMVGDDGRVKVLDFGLAKDLGASGPADATLTSAGHTEYGVVMGTPAYMSPEQVAGRAVDHRSDLFSLGILMYQMASGQRPFGGASSIELASAILRDTPALVTDARSDLPDELARLIRRCLEKDPRQRIQTARDVSNDCRDLLRQVSDAGATPVRRSTATVTASTSTRQDEGFRIAVLPIKYSGTNSDLAALAEGLSEEVVTGLSRFSYLRVIARGATSRYSDAGDTRAIGQAVGARYVIDGSLRQAGSTIRVAVQLVDAASGAHLWAETYDRQLQLDQLFALQDDLIPRIVSTCADHFGVLARSISDAVRVKDPRTLSPYEALMRGFGYHHRLSPVEHAEARDVLERAVEQAPANADCWAMLSWVYSHEFGHGFNPRPGSLDRTLDAARRAVDLAPSNHLAYQTLAVALFFRKERAACLSAAERAIALNPLDASNEAMFLIAFTGDWERGCSLIRHAIERNPHHPGWYRLVLALNEYRQSNYRDAVHEAVKANVPGIFWTSMVLAAAHAQLGELDAAQSALRTLLSQKEDFARSAREMLTKWYQGELVDHLIDGLQKAGLEGDRTSSLPPALGRDKAERTTPASSIAVLPFANMSADKDQDYFSDGLAEEIINLLTGVSGLKVIARTSSFAFRGKEQDIRGIAEALGVTHVLEGSVRRAGSRVRVTAQLIVAADGAHAWSERFDRELSDVFELQDEIAAAITQALRIKLSTAPAPKRYVPKLPAYEAYLRAKHHEANVTPESLELAKACYESAIELDPAFALAHLGLGFYWMTIAHFGRHAVHDAVAGTRAAAHAALRIDNSLPEAHALLGIMAAEYDLDWVAAERHFDAPMAREAGSGLIRPLYAGFLFLNGKPARAVELSERAVAQDPLEVWPRMNLHAFLQGAGREKEAYAQAQKALELNPNLVVAQVSIAHFHAAWGELTEAVTAARKVYEVGPWYPDARATLAALLRVSGGTESEAHALHASLGTGGAQGDCRAQAAYHLLCGDIDTGADWAEKAIAERDFSMMYYLRFVVCKPLRASHRWPAIARMINLPGDASM